RATCPTNSFLPRLLNAALGFPRRRFIFQISSCKKPFAARYRKDSGIGTLIAIMLPYTLFMLIGWSLLFFVWVFLLGLPVGPGSATYYTL
ncbi:MAG: AbgT family transporter, partial [Halomonas sp.]|uniref:AbgT family transporter n=1 Tax=Halomonas sp. TaxID=1486246 RepID=UPI003F98D7A3